MSDGSGRAPTADGSALRALAAARAETRAMSDRLLDHLPDVGDLATQRLLDAWVEQAADALRALSEMAEERLLDLGRPSTPDGIPTRYAAEHLASSPGRLPRRAVADEPAHRRPGVGVGARRCAAHPVGAVGRPRHRPRRLGVPGPTAIARRRHRPRAAAPRAGGHRARPRGQPAAGVDRHGRRGRGPGTPARARPGPGRPRRRRAARRGVVRTEPRRPRDPCPRAPAAPGAAQPRDHGARPRAGPAGSRAAALARRPGRGCGTTHGPGDPPVRDP